MRTESHSALVPTLCALLLADTSPSLGDGFIYWTDLNAKEIWRAELDGANPTLILSQLNSPLGIGIDDNGKLYWSDNEKLWRSDLDGSDPVELVTATVGNHPNGRAIDNAGGKVYWVENGTSRPNDGVRRANLDGSGVETILTLNGATTVLGGISLDPANGTMYFADRFQEHIYRANTDGSGLIAVVSNAACLDVDVDLAGAKIYWADFNEGTIERAALDGSNREVMISGLGAPEGVTIDQVAQKIYWTNHPADRIRCADLDGSNMLDVLTGLPTPRRVAVYRTLQDCSADWNHDCTLSTNDFIAYLNDYNAVLNGGDWTFGNPDIAFPQGALNTADFVAFLNAYAAGCS